MAMDLLKRVPVREQDPQVRAHNFDEVCLGYNREEAMQEAGRCLRCDFNNLSNFKGGRRSKW